MKKKRIKLQKDVIAILTVAAVVLIYIVAELVSAVHVRVVTQTATEITAYDSVDATALAVRNEGLYNAGAQGVVVPSVADGGKISVGGEVAKVFDSQETAARYSEVRDLETQLQAVQALESSAGGLVTDVESANESIALALNTYIRAMADGSWGRADELLADLNGEIVERQLIIGEDVDFSAETQSINARLNELKAQAYQPSDTLTTDTSGVFSGYTDGLENLVDYDAVTSVTSDQLAAYLEKAKSSETTGALGKMIYSYDWYFLCAVDRDALDGLENGDTVEVCLKSDADTVIDMRVVSGADTSAQAQTAVLVLQSNQMTGAMTSYRTEEIEIRLKSYQGLRVPKEAVREVDGVTGVYTLVSQKIEFRPIEVLYTGDTYVVAKYDSGDDDGLRLYDQVITEGKDLYDGKVYT